MASTRPFTFLRGGETSAFELNMLLADDIEGVITHVTGQMTLGGSGTFSLLTGPVDNHVAALGAYCSSIPVLPVFFTGLWIPVGAGDFVGLTWAGEGAADFLNVVVTGFVYPLGDTFDGPLGAGGGALSVFSF